MEFLQWLKSEHQEAQQLLQKALQSEGRAREQAWQKFCNEMKIHHRLEEKYLYPLGEGFGPTREIAAEAIEETQKTERLLDELDPSASWFVEEAEELQRMLEEHIEKEENELVPRLMEDVPIDQQSKLVQKLQEAKQFEMQSAR